MSDENPIAIAQKILSEITTGRNKDTFLKYSQGLR